jgi:hypothetical protein
MMGARHECIEIRKSSRRNRVRVVLTSVANNILADEIPNGPLNGKASSRIAHR